MKKEKSKTFHTSDSRFLERDYLTPRGLTLLE